MENVSGDVLKLNSTFITNYTYIKAKEVNCSDVRPFVNKTISHSRSFLYTNGLNIIQTDMQIDNSISIHLFITHDFAIGLMPIKKR